VTTAPTNGKAKTNGKRPAQKASDPFKVTWEKMEPYQDKYARHDLKEAEPLADLLHEKWLASLTPEQYAIYTTLNGLRHTTSDFFAREEHQANMRNLPDRVELAGRFFTLEKVRQQVNDVKTLLLGFEYKPFGWTQRAKESKQLIADLAASQAEQEAA
jgi:hypothetical protein